MTDLQIKTLCAMIGLVRAIEGNEHFISEQTDYLLLRGLHLTEQEEDKTALQKLMEKIDALKRKLIPGCYTCGAPCGKTAAPSSKLFTESDDLALRLTVLTTLREQPFDAATLYPTLYRLGMSDISAKELHQLAANLNTKS